MSVSMLLEQVNTADEQLEARLCTMLQSVRVTKQFWFLRHSELKCMICEWPPSLTHPLHLNLGTSEGRPPSTEKLS